MDPTKPPLTCRQCGEVIAPGEALTLGIAERSEDGEPVVTELAVFHQGCWDIFQREHGLVE